MAKNDKGTAVLIDEAATEAQGMEEITAAVLAQAEQFEIVTREHYVESADLLKQIKSKQAALDGLRRSMTRPLDEAKSRIMDLFRPAGERLSQAEDTLKDAMIGFTREQERLRQEAERVARLAAEKEAERLRRQAERARARGKDEKAEDLEEQAETVPVPIVPSQSPAVSGVAFRTTWRAEVHDLKALVTACAKGQAPLALLQPNMVVLNTQARSLKKELNIPGVRAVSDEGVAARGS
jgi:hypothetical protein